MSSISIIICSRTSELPAEMQQNIADSIGVDYELIVIDNSKNEYSIFEAYNIGIQKAKGDILCFCHEDILFKTYNWGQPIIRIFNSYAKIGIVGVAGAHFLPDTPMYWSSSPFISEYNLSNDNGIIIEFFTSNYYNAQNLAEVVAVDGLCFFMRKELLKDIQFDESSYKGFHMYDMDICMQVIDKGYKVFVTKDILIEHAWSEKAMSAKTGMELFEKNLSIFCYKWRNMLPLHKGIDSIPDEVLERINILCKNAYDAKKARQSKRYKIGKFLLSPLSALKSK